MLHARAAAGEQQCHDQRAKTVAEAGGEKSRCRDRGARGKRDLAAEPLGDEAGRQLQPRHRADIERAQQADLGVAEPELRLPDRQQHIEQVGVAIVQRVHARRSDQRAALGQRDPGNRRRHGAPADTRRVMIL
jgi:hypothetical protein